MKNPYHTLILFLQCLTVKSLSLILEAYKKEAYFLQKNCIILRDETEWIELINNKNNILVGCDTNLIIEAFQNRKSLNQDFSKTFYGKSNTANLIIEKNNKC